MTKGIILCGGAGTRLKPATDVVGKSLLPILNRPLIYHPLSTLMLAGITEILLISTPKDTPILKELLGDGTRWGIKLSYLVQEQPKGLAQALILGEEFLAGNRCCMMLGDNVLHGNLDFLRDEVGTYGRFQKRGGCVIFAKEVVDPERFGVVEFDEKGLVLSLQEKPAEPRSNYAVPGLYLFDSSAPERARGLVPSARGELEIVDLIKTYQDDLLLRAVKFGRSMVWLDTGTPESLLDAANYIHNVQKHSGQQVADLDEIARCKG